MGGGVYREDGRKGGKVDAIQGRKLDHSKKTFMQNLQIFTEKKKCYELLEAKMCNMI